MGLNKIYFFICGIIFLCLYLQKNRVHLRISFIQSKYFVFASGLLLLIQQINNFSINFDLEIKLLFLFSLYLNFILASKNSNKIYSKKIISKYRLDLFTKFVVFFSLVISIYFIFNGIGNFMSTDEPRWLNYFDNPSFSPNSYEQGISKSYIQKSYSRSQIYWDSYLRGDFMGTLVVGYTGKSVALLYLPAYLLKGLNLDDYLMVVRGSVAIHNLLLVLLSFFLVKKLFNLRSALILLVTTFLIPMFLGYSRIVNHDSISGLYSFLVFLFVLYGIKFDSKFGFVFAGLFYGLALLSSGKMVFLTFLLFLSPLISYFLSRSHSDIQIFIKRIGLFFFTSTFILIFLLPGLIYYPKLIFELLLFPSGFKGIVLIFIYLFIFILFHRPRFFLILNKYFPEKFIIRTAILALGIFFSYIIFNRYDLVKLSANLVSDSYFNALQVSLLKFLAGIPIILLLLFLIWLIAYFINPKFDISVICIFLFFVLFFLSVYFSGFVGSDSGFNILVGKYQFIFIFFFILGLSTSSFLKNLNKNYFNIFLITLCIVLTMSCISINPYFIHYNNFLLPEGYIINDVGWSLGSFEAAEYINSNYEDVSVYDGTSRGLKFFNSNKKILGWTENFDSLKPDLLIFYYTHPNLDVRWKSKINWYYNNMEPVWSQKINNATLVAIYEYSESKN